MERCYMVVARFSNDKQAHRFDKLVRKINARYYSDITRETWAKDSTAKVSWRTVPFIIVKMDDGTYLVNNPVLAKYIKLLANAENAIYATIAEVLWENPMAAISIVAQQCALNRPMIVEKAVKQVTYTITCLIDMATYTVKALEDKTMVGRCPKCYSDMILVKTGKMYASAFAVPDGNDYADYWVRSRFANGVIAEFVPFSNGKSAKALPSTVNVPEQFAKEAEMMLNSHKLLRLLKCMDIHVAMSYMDACFALHALDQEKEKIVSRDTERINAITRFLKEFNKTGIEFPMSKIQMAPPQDHFDIFDAALLFKMYSGRSNARDSKCLINRFAKNKALKEVLLDAIVL